MRHRPDGSHADGGSRYAPTMTILISIVGFVFRFTAALLTTALGWASTLMFGRVPRSHQIFVVLMLAGSLTWMVLLLCVLVPGISGFFLDLTPHPPFIDRPLLGVAFLVGLVVTPLVVGTAAYLVPDDGDRPEGLAIAVEILRGYLLVPILCVLLLFLPAVGISRKARSVSRRWSDVHIPIVVKPKGYDRLVADLQETLAEVDLPVEAEDAPRVLSFPAWLLSKVAGNNVRKMRPDRLVELEGQDLRVGVYPSDIAISGPAPVRARARAGIISRLATTAAFLTTSAEAQAIEERLHHLAERLATPSGAPARDVAAALAAVDEALLELEVPVEEWDILYRCRLQVERDALAGTGSSLPRSAAARTEAASSAEAEAPASARGVSPEGAV